MSIYALEVQLKKQSAAALAAGRDNRGDREETGAAMFGAFASAGTAGVSFDEAVALAKAGGWPVVIHQAGEWVICDAGGSCQIRREMADRDDSREYWA